MRLANRLVGNTDDATVIEVTATGPTLRFGVATHVTLVAAGGEPDAVELRVDGRPVSPGTVVPVGAGQRVAVGRIGTGLRAYLAVSGGFDLPAQLGSRSADVLCGLGPPPLAAGDRLALGAPTRPHGLLLAPSPADGSRRPRDLRVLPGPHRLAPGRLRRLLSGTWMVGEASNRIGIRLAPVPPDRLQASADAPAAGAVLGDVSGDGSESTVDTTAGADTIPSTGMVTGAVQVPPDGHPIILMPDHATVGGYPVACCVISADFPILGQLVPGDTLSLTVVDRDRRPTAPGGAGSAPSTSGSPGGSQPPREADPGGSGWRHPGAPPREPRGDRRFADGDRATTARPL